MEKNNSGYFKHKDIGPYFEFLCEGNFISARLEHGFVTEKNALKLFEELREKLNDKD